MVQKMVAVESMKCFIVLTNTAREAIKQHFQDEHEFFNLQPNFDVFIEKQSVEETSLSLTIYFDNVRNKKLAKKFDERVVIMDCIFDLKNGLVAKSFRTRGKQTPIQTNRREHLKIHFAPSRINGHTYPEKFIKTLANLPEAKKRYDYINKRIMSWEGYLKVLNKNADFEDIDTTFDSFNFSSDFSILMIRCQQIEDKQWKQLKGLSAYIKGIQREIGQVLKAHRQNRTIEIELTPQFTKRARNNEFEFTSESITFSNASTKSQLNRLLKGFERLKDGLAANANLENILFEDELTIAERKNDLVPEFHNNLNEYQREAVIGAMNAEDLYVIQGPPGTGKTTVISEICSQNVKAGLKTLIASQSNLAVDNALGRLLSHKDIRILRYGRTESIEEEGKKFIEENVAQYWKVQTYEAITNEIQQHETKEDELKNKIREYEDEIEQLKEKEKQLHLDIKRKKQAKLELDEITEEISSLKKQLLPLKKEREKAEETLKKLQTSYESFSTNLNEIKQQIESIGSATEIDEQLKEIDSKILNTKHLITYSQLQQLHKDAKEKLSSVTSQLEQLQSSAANLNDTVEKINGMKKIQEIEQFIDSNEIRRGYVLTMLFSDFEKIRDRILEFKSLNEVSDRLEKAIDYSNKTIGIQVEQVSVPPNHHYSLQEINEFLTKLSEAFVKKTINRLNGARSIQGLHMRRLYLQQLKTDYQHLIKESVLVFNKIKSAVIEQFMEQAGFSDATTKQLQQQVEQQKKVVLQYNDELSELEKSIDDPTFIPSSDELQSIIDILQQQKSDLEATKEQIEPLKDQLSKKEVEVQKVKDEIERGEKHVQQLQAEFKQLNSKGLALESKADELVQITQQNPEAELEKITLRKQEIDKQIQKCLERIERLPIAASLQKQWKSLLEQSTEHDLDEIRKLYVKHANVIGTTCVASANKEFMDNYPTFDVVIIDEVSKATPPELLLPMLKGKKIVLVGDHHQLPPLVGDDTFEETLETIIKESDTFEEKRELEKLLEESLFERLYKNLPKSNKQMLAIQYRMHESIMKTIEPFYENEGDSLKCGLADSDSMRDHKLSSDLIKRHEHLLWVDMPNEKPFFEQRMKEGSSLFNESELKVIENMLLDLNSATERAKADSLIPKDELKSVGVISFYAEQVKRINRLIEQLDLKHLHIRTGSVDKFQGMEMDVILVSMVRNHDNPKGGIGFAQDYRRLNVALSRARELLVLIGSSELFTKRPKREQVRNMYSNLLEIVKNQQGHRDHHGNVINEGM